MTEGPIVGPPSRGKKNPRLAAELAAERRAAAEALAAQMEEEAAEAEAYASELADDAGETPEDAGFSFVRSGRVCFAKTTSPIKVDEGEAHWFSFGITEHVDPDTDLGSVFEEMKDITNSAVLGMAADMQDRLALARAENLRRPISRPR